MIIQIPKKIRYPDVYTFSGNNCFSISTRLRKKHIDGKWYTVLIGEVYQGTDNLKCVQRFIQHVYQFEILGKIDLNLIIYDTNKPLFELDDDQRDEIERLSDKYNLSLGKLPHHDKQAG